MNHIQSSETLVLKKYDIHEMLILPIFLSNFAFYDWLLHFVPSFVLYHVLHSPLPNHTY